MSAPRIIAGEAARIRLSVPKGDDVRPTAMRVREALFSHLGGAVRGASVLDLCCGTGALALEALSRGARSAVLVERSAKVAAIARANVRACRFEDRARVVVQDAVAFLRNSAQRFDVVFCDPPYRSGVLAAVAAVLDASAVLAPDGTAVFEHDRPLDVDFRRLRTDWSRRYGATWLTIVRPGRVSETEQDQ